MNIRIDTGVGTGTPSIPWAVADNIVLTVYKNGVAYKQIARHTIEVISSSRIRIRGSLAMRLAAGDFIGIYYAADQSNTIDQGTVENFLSISEIK